MVLRGKDQACKDLIIAREYISHGMRRRASQLATEWLGPRSDREMRESAHREINHERWTGLDRALQQQARNGAVDLAVSPNTQAPTQRTVLIGRLQRLTSMGLATPSGVNVWKLRPDFEKTLRAMGERGDIVRTMQRAIGNRQRQLEVFAARPDARPLVGSVIGKGLADELLDRGYLVVDGIDGRAHYVALNNKADLSQYPIGAIVEVGSTTQPRSADKTIATLAKDGLYRTDDHLVALRAQSTSDVGDLMGDDQVVLGIHRGLDVVADHAGALPLVAIERASASVSETCPSGAACSCCPILWCAIIRAVASSVSNACKRGPTLAS